jgi:hypothetical protein
LSWQATPESAAAISEATKAFKMRAGKMIHVGGILSGKLSRPQNRIADFAGLSLNFDSTGKGEREWLKNTGHGHGEHRETMQP